MIVILNKGEGLGAWVFKGKECKLQVERKERMFGRQMLAGQLGQNETQRTLIQTASLGSSLSVIPSSYHNHIYGDMIHIISVVITLFLEQVFHVNSFKAVECDIKSFS